MKLTITKGHTIEKKKQWVKTEYVVESDEIKESLQCDWFLEVEKVTIYVHKP